MRTCRGCLFVCLVSAAAFAAAASAQSTYTWNNATATDWLNAGNWSGTPTSFPGLTGNNTGNNAGDQAVFGATVPSFVEIDMSKDAARGLLQLGAITYSNTSSSLVISNGATSGGGSQQLQLNGATVTIAGVPTANVILYNSSPSQFLAIQSSLNRATKPMEVTLAATNSVINAASGATIIVTTPISETSGGAKGITFSGQGSFVLSGESTYTGATTVTGGTLVATNSTGSATGDGAVTVSSGGRLAGTGAIIPNTGSQSTNTVSVAGTIQPGTDSATGYLTLGGSGSRRATVSVTGTFAWSLSNSGTGSATPPVNGASDTNDSSNQSRLVVNGDLTLSPTTVNVIGLTGLSFDNTKYYSWTIATATGTVTVGAQPTFNVTGLNTGGGTFTLSGGVGTGYLNFTPIPEPATILLLCGVATGAVVGVRRWRNSGSVLCRTYLPQGGHA